MTKIFKNLKKIVGLSLALIIGAGLGFSSMSIINSYNSEMSPILSLTIFYISITVSVLIQIAIHELGHLIGGLLSGYEFSSYRFLNFMWVNINGKIEFKRMKISGTAGQCLMTPPNKNYNEIPYFLYNVLGGGMNIILSLILLPFLFIRTNEYIAVTSFFVFVFGLIFALQNLIPLKVSGIANDGMNILQCKKSEYAREGLFRQLKIASLLAKGQRLKDFDSEVFIVRDGSENKDSLSAGVYTSYLSKILDEGDYPLHIEKVNDFLKNNPSLLGILKAALRNDLITSYIIMGYNKADILKLINKEFKNYQKAMKTNLGFIRTEYALNLIVYKNENQAKKVLDLFNRCIKNHPYKGDIESECELISKIQECNT